MRRLGGGGGGQLKEFSVTKEPPNSHRQIEQGNLVVLVHCSYSFFLFFLNFLVGLGWVGVMGRARGG